MFVSEGFLISGAVFLVGDEKMPNRRAQGGSGAQPASLTVFIVRLHRRDKKAFLSLRVLSYAELTIGDFFASPAAVAFPVPGKV